MSEQNEVETNPVVKAPLNEFAPEKELTIERNECHFKS